MTQRVPAADLYGYVNRSITFFLLREITLVTSGRIITVVLSLVGLL